MPHCTNMINLTCSSWLRYNTISINLNTMERQLSFSHFSSTIHGTNGRRALVIHLLEKWNLPKHALKPISINGSCIKQITPSRDPSENMQPVVALFDCWSKPCELTNINFSYISEKLVFLHENSIVAIMLTAIWSKLSILSKHHSWFVQIWIQRHNLQKLFFFRSFVSSSIDRDDSEVFPFDVPLIPFLRRSEAIALNFVFFTWHVLVVMIQLWLALIGSSCFIYSRPVLWQLYAVCSFKAKLLKFTPPFMNAI